MVLYSTVQYSTVQYVQYCTVLYYMYSTVLYSTVWIVVSYSYVLYAYSTICLGSRTWPPLHLLDAVVAMRSEKSRGPEGHGDGNFLVYYYYYYSICRVN